MPNKATRIRRRSQGLPTYGYPIQHRWLTVVIDKPRPTKTKRVSWDPATKDVHRKQSECPEMTIMMQVISAKFRSRRPTPNLEEMLNEVHLSSKKANLYICRTEPDSTGWPHQTIREAFDKFPGECSSCIEARKMLIKGVKYSPSCCACEKNV